MRHSLADRGGWSSEHKSQLGGRGAQELWSLDLQGQTVGGREGRTRLAFYISVCRGAGREVGLDQRRPKSHNALNKTRRNQGDLVIEWL